MKLELPNNWKQIAGLAESISTTGNWWPGKHKTELLKIFDDLLDKQMPEVFMNDAEYKSIAKALEDAYKMGASKKEK